MTRTYYGLTLLDGYNSHNGELCVIVAGPISGEDDSYVGHIYDVDSNGIPYTDAQGTSFIGAGICKYSMSQYSVTIEHTTYAYDKVGNPTNSNAIGTKLYLGTVLNGTAAAGNVIPGTTTATVSTSAGTRASTVESKTEITYKDSNSTWNTIINSMNVRDEFANNALRGIIAHIPDVTTLSKNEIAYYCEQAYKWAEYMMTSCANTRGSYENGSGSVNTNNTDTEQYLQELVNSVNQSKQGTITLDVSQAAGLRVNGGNSYGITGGTGTFSLGFDGNRAIPMRGDVEKWNAYVTESAFKARADAWATQADFLKWSSLTSYDNNNQHKIAKEYIDYFTGTNVGTPVRVASGGTTEVGTFLDLHDFRQSNENATNYNTRIQLSTPTINTDSSGNRYGNTVILPSESGTLALKSDIDPAIEAKMNTITWWGQHMQNSAVTGTLDNVGSINMTGNINMTGQNFTGSTQGVIMLANNKSIQMQDTNGTNITMMTLNSQNSVSFGYGARVYGYDTTMQGNTIIFFINKDRTAAAGEQDASHNQRAFEIFYDANDGVCVKIGGSNGKGGTLSWDSSRNAIKVEGNLYATGGVSALGANTTTSGYKFSNNLEVSGSVTATGAVKGSNIDLGSAKLTVEGSELYITIGSQKYKLTKTQVQS